MHNFRENDKGNLSEKVKKIKSQNDLGQNY